MLEKHYLDDLFNPQNVAIIGASDRIGSVGYKVMSNMCHAQFPGKLFPINPKHQQVQNQRCFSSVTDITDEIDLAVIATPAAAVPQVVKECGQKGIRSAIIISAGFSEIGVQGKALEQTILDLAKQYQIHFIGPNCLGVMRPVSHLNATFDNNFALCGDIALVSQSGAICAAILDWALEREIGFSTIVSMGNSVDLDFGDMLNYLALDPATKSILLYIEGVHYPRRFLSGLRAAARVKPVIAIKAGRNTSGARAVHSHTGALVGGDDVFSAALMRAGAVRVDSIEQLFSAAKILSTHYRAKGNRLTIISNGGGAGVMAADRASDLNIQLPQPNATLLATLNDILPPQWSHQNPIDILGDATPERYQKTIEACLNDDDSDALLAILVPVAMSKPDEVAEKLCYFAKDINKPLIACWMGEKQTKKSWQLFIKNKVPYFSTPERAVEAFSYLANYYHNQQLLLQVPAPLSISQQPDIDGAKCIISKALDAKRHTLTTVESKSILNAFDIPASQAVETHSANEAAAIAESLGFPIVMKISSPDITHKQDVDGVQLNINSGEAVRNTFNKMMEKVKALKPDARISGITVERMYKHPNNRELMIGVVRDKVFGPVISFGLGGSLVEIIRDRAVALPPLNTFLAQQLIERTRAFKLLKEFRGKPAVDIDALINVLLHISDMICELPQIQEMDINPLLINEKEVIAVDARIIVDPSTPLLLNYSHMAIHPYPKKLISHWQTSDGVDIIIRPIRPEDARAEQDFIANLSPSSNYFRFMHEVKELTPTILARFTQIDYETEMAFVATVQKGEQAIIIGIARYFTQASLDACEFAIAVADDWQHKGLGTHLMNVLMKRAKSQGIKSISGRILSDNADMLTLVKELGFNIHPSDERSVKEASKILI